VYTGTPNICVDGVYVNVSDSYTSYRNHFNIRKVIDSPLAMSLTLEDYDNTTGAGLVRVTARNVSGAAVSGYLRMAVAGDDTVGTFGYFSHVRNPTLHIFPGAQGIYVMLLPGATRESVEAFQIPVAWRHKPCTITAFVQDDTANREIRQAAVLHDVVMGLSGEVSGGTLTLSWPAISGVGWYWVYGASNETYFEPGLASPHDHRLAMLFPGVTSWSTSNGIGDPAANWSYLVIAVDGSQQELTRSNRVGEFGFDTAVR
jgi:hypothetical protein